MKRGPVVTGCTPVSEGCTHCYAATAAAGPYLHQHERYAGLTAKGKWTGEVRLNPDVLAQPLHWRKPRKVFVASMGDLFHQAVPFDYILKVFGVAMATPWHTYQLCTKRPERMVEFFRWWQDEALRQRLAYGGDALAIQSIAHLNINWIAANQYYLSHYDQSGRGKLDLPVPWPYPNVWGMVTAENQQLADERIPLLLASPFIVRGVSVEPMLGPVDLSPYFQCNGADRGTIDGGIDWAVVGAESSPKRRPCNLEWVRDLLSQCEAGRKPAFIKQLDIDGKVVKDIEKFPTDLQVREWPSNETGGG